MSVVVAVTIIAVTVAIALVPAVVPVMVTVAAAPLVVTVPIAVASTPAIIAITIAIPAEPAIATATILDAAQLSTLNLGLPAEVTVAVDRALEIPLLVSDTRVTIVSSCRADT
jgi:hypothetical protein